MAETEETLVGRKEMVEAKMMIILAWWVIKCNLTTWNLSFKK